MVEKRYSLVPTTCFNCESACGLLAYVDKESGQVSKFEGNPHHPGSRGRNCAKGPATINQINDTERILHPMKRVGPRGEGGWERVSWDQALDEISTKIRDSLKTGAKDRVVYHVGRPGHEGYTNRILKAWGVDGHNSHTNICSAGARTGYALWHRHDRPSPDHANAKGDPANLLAPGNWALLQPACPEDPGGNDGWCKAGCDRPPPFQHRGNGRPLGPDVARIGVSPFPLLGQHDPREGACTTGTSSRTGSTGRSGSRLITQMRRGPLRDSSNC